MAIRTVETWKSPHYFKICVVAKHLMQMLFTNLANLDFVWIAHNIHKHYDKTNKYIHCSNYS